MSDVNTGCGLAGMRSLKAGSVDLVFCDLPSGDTRASFDVPIDLAEFWAAAWPALSPSGAVVLMASSFSFACDVRASQRRWLRYDLVWEKTRATGHLNAKRQPMRCHEHLLVFYRRQPAYESQKTQGHEPMHTARGSGRSVNYGQQTNDVADRGGSTERHPRSVLKFAPVPNVGNARRHPQQKPLPLLDWVIRSYTRAGDLVVDPCAGSGSAGVAARAAGRDFIGWDIDPKPPALEPQ